MVETIQFLAFPDNILNVKSHLDFETLILNLPEKIVQDLDQSIAKLKSMESCFFTTYRVPEINLHNFIHLRLLNFKGHIDLEDVKILVNSKGLYAEIIASVEDKFNYWFVELKLFNTEVDHENDC
ncbi:hypothetical protein [Acinetobacter seifertii]|uniref:hypothetical protein n=1 Tax=Acinetobacter calcoaceticus/baumannii complex TaxID=909768 RepID=UPI001D17A833|nr:hypothetical protein [Acinetobacter seifertii]